MNGYFEGEAGTGHLVEPKKRMETDPKTCRPCTIFDYTICAELWVHGEAAHWCKPSDNRENSRT